MRTLFLAWQDPERRRWHTVGRLDVADAPGTDRHTFAYTNAALEAQADAGFRPLPAFPDLHMRYTSADIFPLFANRVMGQNRPEYADFVEWMSVAQDDADPVALLARSGGRRATDSLEIFPSPQRNGDGRYHVNFFVHGLRHQAEASSERANALEPGEPLRLMADFMNEWDHNAMMVRTAERVHRDMHLLGYLPRYLAGDLSTTLGGDYRKVSAHQMEVAVERVNPPPAPVNFRLLCRVTMQWPGDYEPFSDRAYQPLDA